jgi:hypothetical protein
VRDSQRLLGQDAIPGQAMVATLGGAPQPGNAYTVNSIDSVTLTSAIAVAPTINLASGNTLAGFTVGHTNGSYAISGAVAGTVSVRQVAINSAGGGGLRILTSGSFVNDATFTGFSSITATGGTNGMALVGLTGTFTVNTGALSGATGVEFFVDAISGQHVGHGPTCWLLFFKPPRHPHLRAAGRCRTGGERPKSARALRVPVKLVRIYHAPQRNISCWTRFRLAWTISRSPTATRITCAPVAAVPAAGRRSNEGK